MRHFAALTTRRRAAGFSLFELAVAVIVIALLAGVLLQRLLEYREQVELAAVERMAGVLRIALVIRVGQLRSHDAKSEILALAGQNPLEWLSDKPPNYLGEYFSPDQSSLARGNWYFDRKTKVLVYLLNNEKKFPYGTSNSICFKVELLRLPSNTAKQKGAPGTISVSLIQVNE